MRKKFDDAVGIGQEFKAAGNAKNRQNEGDESSLIRKHGILVHHGVSRSAIDVGDFIGQQRNSQIALRTQVQPDQHTGRYRRVD